MVIIELAVPLHSQVVDEGVDWAEAEGTLDIYLGHQGSTAKAHDGVHGIVHCGVAGWEVGVVDTIVELLPGR